MISFVNLKKWQVTCCFSQKHFLKHLYLCILLLPLSVNLWCQKIISGLQIRISNATDLNLSLLPLFSLLASIKYENLSLLTVPSLHHNVPYFFHPLPLTLLFHLSTLYSSHSILSWLALWSPDSIFYYFLMLYSTRTSPMSHSLKCQPQFISPSHPSSTICAPSQQRVQTRLQYVCVGYISSPRKLGYWVKNWLKCLSSKCLGKYLHIVGKQYANRHMLNWTFKNMLN